jgi:hypothetical protein
VQVSFNQRFQEKEKLRGKFYAPDMIDMLRLLFPLTSSLGRKVGSSTTSSPESEYSKLVSGSILSAKESVLSLFGFLVTF